MALRGWFLISAWGCNNNFSKLRLWQYPACPLCPQRDPDTPQSRVIKQYISIGPSPSQARPASTAQHSRSWADKLALAFLILYLTKTFWENIMFYASSPILPYSRHYECRAHRTHCPSLCTKDPRWQSSSKLSHDRISNLLSWAARSRVCLTIVTTTPRPG